MERLIDPKILTLTSVLSLRERKPDRAIHLGRDPLYISDSKKSATVRDRRYINIEQGIARSTSGDGRAGGVTGHLNDCILRLQFIDFFLLLAKDVMITDRWITPATSEAVKNDLLSTAIDQLVISATGCLKFT